jgi:adenine deaminase
LTNSIDSTTRTRGIAAAQGLAPFDVLLTGGMLVDVATCELRPADIGIVGPMIASVHSSGALSNATERHDVTRCFLAPGFIDTHVHFESSHLTPANYASIVVPQCTTTIFFDPHELANVLGVRGVRYAIEASRGLPLRFICAAPSCVPSAPGLEMTGADLAGTEMREMLSWNEVAGLAEMMDMKGVLAQRGRTMEILAAAHESGKLIEGHARGLSGASLQAYMASGVSSDHEITSGEDGIEKLRAGMTVELRGSHDYVLPKMVEALNRLPQIPPTLTICTDDVPPDHLVEHGGMCDVLRRLIRYGMEPVQAIRCATLHASFRLRRPDLGLIAAGRIADVAVLSNLHEVTVASVFASGKLAARQGKMVVPITPPDVRHPIEFPLPLPSPELTSFRVPVPGVRHGRARLRCIKGVRFTEWTEVDVEVRDGYAELPAGHSVIFVQHRHGRRDATPQRALLSDWGELDGAIATTYSHDSHNLVVLGRDPADMKQAAEALIACGGGMAVVKAGRLLARLPLPVAGMLSTDSGDEVADAFRRVREAAGLVVEWNPPYRVFKAIEGTSLACNPGPHLTDLGLTDGSTGQIVDPIIATTPA